MIGEQTRRNIGTLKEEDEEEDEEENKNSRTSGEVRVGKGQIVWEGASPIHCSSLMLSASS